MIGPTLPPSLREGSGENEEDKGGVENNYEGSDAYGPELPPALAARRAAARPAAPVIQQEDDESDDDVGPRPPGASTTEQEVEDGVREFLAREERRRQLAKVRTIVSTLCIGSSLHGHRHTGGSKAQVTTARRVDAGPPNSLRSATIIGPD